MMSDLAEVLKRIRSADKAQPLRLQIGRNPPPTAAELSIVETDVGLSLPEDFKRAISVIGTGDIGYAWIFGVRPGEEPTLQSINGSRLQPRRDFLAFSDNGAGDYFGFVVVNGCAGSEVAVLDHETGALKVAYDSIASWLAGEAVLADSTDERSAGEAD
jgi:hypothetical protein